MMGINLLYLIYLFLIGARRGIRTPKPKKAEDFKSSVYTIPPSGLVCKKITKNNFAKKKLLF